MRRGPSVPLYEQRWLRRAVIAFVEYRGAADADQRAKAIANLPTIDWKGRTLYTLECRGGFGKGPHTVHVPESLLWALIAFEAYRCPFHAGGF